MPDPGSATIDGSRTIHGSRTPDGSQRSARLLSLAASAVVALAASAYCLSFDRPWALRGENATSLFPMAADAWHQWTAGRFPAWTGSLIGGFPLFAGAQSSALYLPHALVFAVTPEPHWRAMDLALALHAGLLAGGCVRLLLHLGARPVAALTGAALCVAAPQIVYWTNFVPIYASLAWWPWLFLAADRLAAARDLPAGAFLLATAALAAQVFAGFVEFALYGGCLAAAWIVTSSGGAKVASRIGRAGLLGASAALVAAPQLVPTAFEIAAGGRTIGGEELQQRASLALASIANPFAAIPAAGLASAFFGGATLALALVAVATRARRSALLSGLLVVAVLFSLGPATPLHGWLTSIPPFSLFRNPVKVLAAAELAVALLAGLGLDALLRRSDRRALVAASLLGAVAVAEHAIHLVRQLDVVARPHLAGELEIPRDVEGLAVFADELRQADPRTGLPHRMVKIGAPFFGSMAEVYGIDSMLGGLPALVAPRPFELLRARIGPAWLAVHRLDPAWLDLLAVDRVVATGACERFARPTLRALRSAHGLCLLENPSSPPRVELLRRAFVVADEATELERVLARPAATAPVVFPYWRPGDPPPVWRRPGRLAPGERVELASYRPGAMHLRVATAKPRLLLVRESRNAGWRARVDGENAEILPAAGLFFAVALPVGESEVDLRYHPRGLGLGVAASILWLAAAGLVWRARRARRAAT